MPLNITGRNLYFKSGIDNKQLKKDAKAGNKEIDKMTGKVKKSGQSMAKSLKTAFKFIIGAVIVKKILDIGKALFKAGSDAEEIRSKFEVTFQSINEEADKVAKSLSRGYGLARVKAEELLSTTGDLLTGFGFTRQEALDTSDAVQKLAVDLASFNNLQGGTTQASHILTKALLGERETLTTLGVKILDADLQQELLNRGMSKLTGTALLQAKALITLDMVAIQSKNAIGDFARTSQSAANQGRILKENIKDLTVNLGKKLTPTLANAEIGANKLVRSLVEMTDIKMEDQLEDERTEINLLIGSITSLNEGNDVRKGLIDELVGKYPDLLKNLDQEKITNGDLLKILQDYNLEIDKKIKRVVWEEELLEIEERKKEAYKEEKQLIKDLDNWYSTFIKTKKEGASVEEKLRALKEDELDLSKKWESAATRILLSDITVKSLREDAIKGENNLNEIRQTRLDLTEEYFDLLLEEPPTPEPLPDEEEPEIPEVPVPELTRIEAIKELNGLLEEEIKLHEKISTQLLKYNAKLQPSVVSVKKLFGDLRIATIKEGKQRLRIVDTLIKQQEKLGHTTEGLLNDRQEIVNEILKDIYEIENVMYGIADFVGMLNNDLGQLIGSATQLVTSLSTGDVGGFFSGIVGVFGTIIDVLTKTEEETINTHKELRDVLSTINRNLQLQLKLLAEINGTPWLVGAVTQVQNIRKEMDGLLKKLQEINITETLYGPIADTSEWNIEKWQEVIDYYSNLGVWQWSDYYSNLHDTFQNLIDAYREQEDALASLMDSYMQELTGTTTASIADSIAQGFSEGLDSAAVFANTFEDLMRNALIEALKRSLYDKGLEQFYENFYKAVESGGGLDQDEIDRLREEYNQILANAEAAWASMSELLGDEFALPGEEDPLVGAIRGLSEETAGVLAGQMMAIRINVAEGLEVAENSFLQLVEIAENTSYNKYLEQITWILQQNSEQALLRSGG